MVRAAGVEGRRADLVVKVAGAGRRVVDREDLGEAGRRVVDKADQGVASRAGEAGSKAGAVVVKRVAQEVVSRVAREAGIASKLSS